MARRNRPEPPPAYGWYKYLNTTGADFLLPRPLINGRSMVPRGGTFEADSSYQNTIGVKLIENLSHYIKDTPTKHCLNDVQKPEPEPIREVLTEQPLPVEIIEKSGMVDLTRKELVEFAKLKKVKINASWTKEKILDAIRK